MTSNASSIYVIRHLDSNKLYVGSAVRTSSRWSCHRRQLREGIHHCRHLQRAWAKYGESAFRFEVIERIQDRSKLIEREQFWIDELEPDFNSARVAGSTLGIKYGPEFCEMRKKMMVGKKPSDASVASLVARTKGVPKSPEHKEKIAAAQRGKSKPYSLKYAEGQRRRFERQAASWAILVYATALRIHYMKMTVRSEVDSLIVRLKLATGADWQLLAFQPAQANKAFSYAKTGSGLWAK